MKKLANWFFPQFPQKQIVQLLINKAIETLNKFDSSDLITVFSIAKIRMYLDFAMLEVAQIRRRVIEGE